MVGEKSKISHFCCHFRILCPLYSISTYQILQIYLPTNKLETGGHIKHKSLACGTNRFRWLSGSNPWSTFTLWRKIDSDNPPSWRIWGSSKMFLQQVTIIFESKWPLAAINLITSSLIFHFFKVQAMSKLFAIMLAKKAVSIWLDKWCYMRWGRYIIHLPSSILLHLDEMTQLSTEAGLLLGVLFLTFNLQSVCTYNTKFITQPLNEIS